MTNEAPKKDFLSTLLSNETLAGVKAKATELADRIAAEAESKPAEVTPEAAVAEDAPTPVKSPAVEPEPATTEARVTELFDAAPPVIPTPSEDYLSRNAVEDETDAPKDADFGDKAEAAAVKLGGAALGFFNKAKKVVKDQAQNPNGFVQGAKNTVVNVGSDLDAKIRDAQDKLQADQALLAQETAVAEELKLVISELKTRGDGNEQLAARLAPQIADMESDLRKQEIKINIRKASGPKLIALIDGYKKVQSKVAPKK